MGRRLCAEHEYPSPLLAVAGHRLPGAHRGFPGQPLDDDQWATVLDAAIRHRITGLLNVATVDGALPTTRAQRGEALSVHRRMQMRVLALEHQLGNVADVLADSGVELRILKGSAVARLDYTDPAIRSYIDLDILVRAVDIDRAVQLLGAAGFKRTLAEPRPGFDRRFDKGTTFVAPAGFELDLHRTFVLGPWGVVMNPDEMWDESDPVRIGARTFLALSKPYRFLHACYHAALGNWPLRLASLRDIGEQLRSGQDASTVIAIASAWGVQTLVAAAVADSRRLLGTDADDELTTWSRCHRPSKRDVSWLALHTRTDKTFAAQALATLPVLPWRDRIDYLSALLRPSSAYAAERHGSRPARFAYAVRQIRQGTRRSRR
jgi:hypothetical protein